MGYYERKEEVREEAIEWDLWGSNNSMSWYELKKKQDYFYALAKKYGLVKEFRENGMI